MGDCFGIKIHIKSWKYNISWRYANHPNYCQRNNKLILIMAERRDSTKQYILVRIPSKSTISDDI